MSKGVGRRTRKKPNPVHRVGRQERVRVEVGHADNSEPGMERHGYHRRAGHAADRGIAHLATSRNVPLEQWWSGGDAPFSQSRGSMMKWLRRGMGMHCESRWPSGCGSSIYLVPGTFCCWNSLKP
jgi:hypothetical protein